MIRGTTAKFKFQLPYDFSELSAAKVKFWQPGNEGTVSHPLPIEKMLSACCCGDNSKELCVTLNQEETLRFSDALKAKVQLRAKLPDDTVFASPQQIITVHPLCEDCVIGEWNDPAGGNADIILDGGVLDPQVGE